MNILCTGHVPTLSGTSLAFRPLVENCLGSELSVCELRGLFSSASYDDDASVQIGEEETVLARLLRRQAMMCGRGWDKLCPEGWLHYCRGETEQGWEWGAEGQEKGKTESAVKGRLGWDVTTGQVLFLKTDS